MKKQKLESLREHEIEKWNSTVKAGDEMIPMIGNLYRENNTICTVFGKSLVHKNSVEIIKLHSYVCKHFGYELKIMDSLSILKILVENGGENFHNMRVDLGRTFYLLKDTKEEMGNKLLQLVKQQTSVNKDNLMTEPRDVVLYGFGRIGRLLARLLIEKSGAGVKLMLRAVVVRKGDAKDLMKRASLLRRDSVHGPFHGTISFNEEANAFMANGTFIQVIYADAPEKCDYTQYGINNAIVIDNTGIWRTKDALSKHLQAKGVSKVILTAPGQGDVITIVAGVNNDRVKDDVHIYSAASCTTNAITPCLMALDKRFGIETAHIETVHSFTNDQNLIDNYHRKERRGRSAVLNMVITETGAAKAVVNCLPGLVGKLTANSIRVPTPNVSLAILILQLKEKNLTADIINDYMSKLSINSSLQNQIDFVNSGEAASSDFVGSRACGIVDGQATIVKGNQVNLYVWYDNEFGYSCQVVRLLQTIAKITHARFPDESHSEAMDKTLALPRMASKSGF